MTIEPFRTEDIDPFLCLAAREGWVAEHWEFEFLLSSFARGCFSARDDNGETAGFVTAVRHGTSGWIGNLIVAERFRGRGIGEKLFGRALGALRDDGVETVWLTASKAGKSLYEKHGFRTIDSIVRWVGAGRQRHAGNESHGEVLSPGPVVRALDVQAWGDWRDALLMRTVERGTLLTDAAGFAVIQPCGAARQFGPFAAYDNEAAERVLARALGAIPLGTKICLDAPASNRAALRLFNRRCLKIAGTTELMYAGMRPAYRPDLLYGLATMGSCG